MKNIRAASKALRKQSIKTKGYTLHIPKAKSLKYPELNKPSKQYFTPIARVKANTIPPTTPPRKRLGSNTPPVPPLGPIVLLKKKKNKNGLRSYPRPPKKGASATVLQNWYRKCAEIDQFNKAKILEINQAAKLQDAVYKKVEYIKSIGGKFNKKSK